ncbi:MAG: hypothetical protein CL912_01050 [Deltaproteobacteria bacterium]|nr:hypothetical protein [Deltaproteobacteria bacterium]
MVSPPAQLHKRSWKLYPGIPETVLQFTNEHHFIKTGSWILMQKKLANGFDFLHVSFHCQPLNIVVTNVITCRTLPFNEILLD